MYEPRALWLVPVPDLGGVARHVLDATRVRIPGWNIVVLCPEGTLADKLRAQGSAVTTAPFGPAAGVRASRTSLSRVARALQPTIVHSHLAYADIINAWTPLPRGIRRFTTEHGIAGNDSVYHDSGLEARLMESVHRARFRRFDGVVAVSRATRGAMIAKWHVKQHIEVIPNGVDLPPGVEQRMEQSESLRVLSLSRLAPEKRIDKLIEAFALVKNQRPTATLTVAGEGPLRTELEALCRRLAISDSVTFPGFLDAEAAMAKADVLVQLSVWENLSYTLLDAAAHGIPVVASDVGGNSEVISRALIRDLAPATIAQTIVNVARRPDPVRPPSTVAEMTARLARYYRHGEK